MAPFNRMTRTACVTHPARFFRGAGAAAFVAACLITNVSPGAAQARAGGHVLHKSNIVDGSSGFGGRVEFDLGFLLNQFVIGGTYDRLFPDCTGCTFWQAGVQVGFFDVPGYLGLGGFYSKSTNTSGSGEVAETDWTVALVGGVRVPFKGWFVPFLEIHQELGQGLANRQTLALGILLGPYGVSGRSRTSVRATR